MIHIYDTYDTYIYIYTHTHISVYLCIRQTDERTERYGYIYR